MTTVCFCYIYALDFTLLKFVSGHQKVLAINKKEIVHDKYFSKCLFFRVL